MAGTACSGDVGRELSADVARKLVTHAGEEPKKVNLSSNGIGSVAAEAFAILGKGMLKLNLPDNNLKSFT